MHNFVGDLHLVNMKILYGIILSVLTIMFSCNVLAQTSPDGCTIALTKQGAHYVFSANINDRAEATILLESGIPAMLVDSAFVFSTGIFSDMELQPAEGTTKMNLGGRVYTITHKANCAVKITDQISYRGDVFVLSGYTQNHQAAVPVQYLYNDADRGSRVVCLNLRENSLQMISRTSLRKRQKGSTKIKMHTDTYLSMPAVETTLVIESENGQKQLKGNYIIDFGNPELMFLLQQDQDVQQFLADNPDIQLRQARNPRGEVVAQFMIADQCQLCGKQFSNAVIAITANLPRFTTTGLIGLKFFLSTDSIFDFDNNLMYTL